MFDSIMIVPNDDIVVKVTSLIENIDWIKQLPIKTNDNWLPYQILLH